MKQTRLTGFQLVQYALLHFSRRELEAVIALAEKLLGRKEAA
jgi:hypothetical protein